MMTSRHELGLNKFSQMTSQRVKNKKVRIPKTSFLMSRTGFVWLTNGTTLRNLGQSKTEFKYWTDESDVWSKMKSSGVTVVLYTLWRLWWSIRIHTHTRKNVIYLFYTTKIQMVYGRIFGVWKKINKSSDMIWCRFDAICVCPLIDHGQQPNTQKSRYCINTNSDSCRKIFIQRKGLCTWMDFVACHLLNLKRNVDILEHSWLRLLSYLCRTPTKINTRIFMEEWLSIWREISSLKTRRKCYKVRALQKYW